MIIEDDVVGSQTEDHEKESNTDMSDVLAQFGIEEKEDDDNEQSFNDKRPAKDEVKMETKTIKVKHNKEEIEVDVSDAKIPEYVQKSLALDKERERRTETEKHLDRAAKLAGYKDHTAYVADFDNIEKQQQQKEQDEHNQLLVDLREQAEDAGLDPDKVEAFLKNHPLVKEGERLKQEKAVDDTNKQNQDAQQANISKWQTMYKDPRVLAVFPNIVEDSEAFAKQETPTFFTADMKAKIERGYDPIDAMLLSHADKFQGISRKKTEQQIIKEQHLGMRSRVETNTQSDNETQVPSNLANAFEAFGLPADSAKKYVKK